MTASRTRSPIEPAMAARIVHSTGRHQRDVTPAGPALSVVAVDALNRVPARLDADMHSVRSSRNVH